jgi:hypothetical protein
MIIKPHKGPQEEALKVSSDIFETFFGGSRGPGKTAAGLLWISKPVINPKYRALVIRKNADDLSDWMDRARLWFRGYGATFAYKPSIITFPSGAIIRSGHLGDDQAYTKYQGHEYHRELIEELTQIPNEQRYLQLISSCRSSEPSLPAQVFSTGNPGGVGHAWVKKRFIDTAELRSYQYIDEMGVLQQAQMGLPYADENGVLRIFIPATLDNNPTLSRNDPNYIKRLDQLKEVNYQLWKAWRMGSWDVFIGQVFSEFMQDIHVTDRFDYKLEDCKKIIGFDWGYNHAGSAQWIAICPENRYGISRLYSYRELHQNKTTPELWAQQIAIFTKMEKTEFIVMPHDCYSDREGKESIAKIFERTIQPTGCRVIRGDTLSNGARVTRVALTHQNLSIAPDGKPYWQIHPKCKNLIETLPVMVYSENNPEDVAKIDGDDDYDSVSLGFKTIAATWNINSGVVKQAKPVQARMPWKQEGNQVSTVDFMSHYKSKIKHKSAEKHL